MVEAVTLNSSNEPESDYRDRQIALLRQEVARLHASEQRLLDFAKASTDWHWECDADLKLTFISDEFFEQTGLSREDVIGRRRDEIGLREDPNTVDWAAHLRRLTRRQPFRDFSYAVYDRTGATRHVQVSGVPVYDDNGAFQGYRGSTVDITAQVNARADAERLRQLLEGLLQHQPSAVAIRDLDGRFTVVNPRFAALVGRTPDDLIGYRAEEIFPPSIAELFLAEDAEVRERLEPVSTEYMWEGRVRLKTKFPIFGADRELVAFGAVSTDVTEQRQALNALARQSSLLQALFDNLPDGVLYISNDLRVELANPGAAAMHGYELDELIGLPVDELFTGKVWEKVKRQFTDNPYHALQPRLTQFRRKDDSTYQAEVIAAPVVGSEQDVSGYVALQRDVTERERTSREHAQLSEQLRQSQKMQSLGQLTGGIAHDFNNILASVLGFTGLAQNYCESDERLSRYLREIELAGGRGRDLVKQMLAFGRASPGEPRVVDLGTKVASSMTLLKSTLPASVDFVTQLEPGRWALVDPVQFDQIMMNLVINARDAMDSRGKIYMAVHRISVEGEHCAACAQSFQGDYIALTVADQGPGVTQEIRARMFDPFFTTKDVGQGTGMGLSTVHGITHQHGGHILIDDTPGLAIRILFPVADEPVATEGPEPVLTSTQIKARACRVLVVDDERSVGQFLKELLEMHGHTVYAFASTVDALAWYQDHIAEIDIVVSDLTMPETPGDRFVAELRRLNPDLPAIVTTGIGHIEKQRRLKGLANCQTVDKPIDPAKLLEALAASAHDGLGDPPILKNR